jgi:hypothetical protein
MEIQGYSYNQERQELQSLKMQNTKISNLNGNLTKR